MNAFVPNILITDPIEELLESLKHFDALRDSDTINRGTLDRIEPEFADDWPSRLHLYAMNDPIDRFFVGNLDEFLHKPFDELVVDPANQALIERHLPSLLEESGGSVKPLDRDFLGPAFYESAEGLPGSVPKGYSPQVYLNLRGISGESFALKRNDEEIGQVSEMRRFREAFIGAVFPFNGQRYRVHSHEEKAVILEDCEQHLRTEPAFYPVLYTSDIYDGVGYEKLNVYRGNLNITIKFAGYKLVDERLDAVISTRDTSNALYLNNLHAFWIDFTDIEDTELGIVALEHMIRVGSMFIIPTDRFDTSTYSKTGNEPTTYYYENYPGGIGISSKLFEVWDVALAKGIEIARNCRCSRGCQNCIEPAKSWGMSNPDINKVKGIELAQRLLGDIASGPKTKFKEGLMRPI
jgi:DEAD/DEAH box helicase domain-containing protein